jgi:hypothetical protein
MCFGEQGMHSGRSRSRDLGDTAYLRCRPKTSATNSWTSEMCNMIRWTSESGGLFRTIVTPCRLLNRTEGGYKVVPALSRILSHICDMYCVRVLLPSKRRRYARSLN